MSEAEKIEKAMRIIENVTCVKFVNRKNEPDFVTFSGDTTRCSSKVGRRGGEQFVKLTEGCFGLYSVVHELMHTLGFYHAHKRADRDKHIRILWENVNPLKKHKLEKRTDEEKLTDFGVGYDMESLLHYPPGAFSINGKNTIEVIDKQLFNGVMGQREKLSPKDILRIRRMYECDKNGEALSVIERVNTHFSELRLN